MIRWIIETVVGGVVGKYFDYKIEKAKSDNEKLSIESKKEQALAKVKGEVLVSGAFWFQLFFIVPLSIHFTSVVVYSMLWCKDCIYPYAGLDYKWTIAALPEPLDIAYPYILGFLFLVETGRAKKWW